MATLDLKNNVNILSRLNVKGIFSNNDKYPLKHIFHIIKREVSYEPAIQCNTKSGQQQLYQVHICINKQG
ncbi:unnamed protein product, partial [Musa textilis]